MRRYTCEESAFSLKLVSIRQPCGNTDLTIEGGRVIERGSSNHRWPFHESVLVQSDKDVDAGTCALFSFIREGVLYQVMQLERRCRRKAKLCALINFPAASQVCLNIGIPECFTSAFPVWKNVSARVKAQLYPYEPGKKEYRLINRVMTLTDGKVSVGISQDDSGPESDSVIFLLAMGVYDLRIYKDSSGLESLTCQDIFG